MSHIAIVGCGLVGSGWAIVFARAGKDVMLYDSRAGVAVDALSVIGERLGDLQAAGLIGDPAAIHARIRIAKDLDEAVCGAAYVQESVLEDAAIKAEVMTDIDRVIGPRAWVGSSSSGIAASLYTGHVDCRSRCLVAHPVNPPYLAPIVELVPAPWTAVATVQGVRALMEEVGQVPVEMKREAEGFILNRLQGVLLMEAWRMVEDGLASVADIDKTVSEGLGLRWSFMGPFETIDLNAPGGVADYAARLGALYQRIAGSTREHRLWSSDLIAKVEAERRRVLPADELADRSGWRDRRLMALARHKREMEAEEGSAAKT